jgi:hypothetical protein
LDAPGDLVQVDTVQIRFQNSEVRHQFSARDAITRWDCSRAYRRASSFTAAVFLEYMERKFPFPIRGIQIDGGSEFKKHVGRPLKVELDLKYELNRAYGKAIINSIREKTDEVKICYLSGRKVLRRPMSQC